MKNRKIVTGWACVLFICSWLFYLVSVCIDCDIAQTLLSGICASATVTLFIAFADYYAAKQDAIWDFLDEVHYISCKFRCARPVYTKISMNDRIDFLRNQESVWLANKCQVDAMPSDKDCDGDMDAVKLAMNRYIWIKNNVDITRLHVLFAKLSFIVSCKKLNPLLGVLEDEIYKPVVSAYRKVLSASLEYEKFCEQDDFKNPSVRRLILEKVKDLHYSIFDVYEGHFYTNEFCYEIDRAVFKVLEKMRYAKNMKLPEEIHYIHEVGAPVYS